MRIAEKIAVVLVMGTRNASESRASNGAPRAFTRTMVVCVAIWVRLFLA